MSDPSNLDETLKSRWEALQQERNALPVRTVVSMGGGPHDPGMEARVARLEASLQDIRLSFARIEEALKSLATKTDLVKVEGRLDTLDAKVTALDTRVGRVETNVGTALTTAVGKAIGPMQFLAILAGSAAILTAAATAYGWATHQPWFAH